MSIPAENGLRFRAMTFGVDRRHAVTVGFEMDRRPGQDSRALATERDHASAVYVELGEPQQYCMEGGIEKVESAPGILKIWFTEKGSREMAGLRAIEVNYDDAAAEVPDLLDALDYIFAGFEGYTRNGKPAAT